MTLIDYFVIGFLTLQENLDWINSLDLGMMLYVNFLYGRRLRKLIGVFGEGILCFGKKECGLLTHNV